MFIDANAITDLIEKYEAIAIGMPLGSPGVSFAQSIAKDLEGLIDQEAGRLEKMADNFEFEALEIQRLEFENEAAGDREVDFNWPHGV